MKTEVKASYESFMQTVSQTINNTDNEYSDDTQGSQTNTDNTDTSQTGGNSGSSDGQTSKPSTSTGGSTSSGGSSSGGSSSGGFGDLADKLQQDREDKGYSGADIGGYLTDEDRDWIAGNVQLD